MLFLEGSPNRLKQSSKMYAVQVRSEKQFQLKENSIDDTVLRYKINFTR